jgi:hypothetical protein
MVKKKIEDSMELEEQMDISGEMKTSVFSEDPNYPYEPLKPGSNELKEPALKKEFVDSGSYAMKGPEKVEVVSEKPKIPVRVTLYQAYRRQYFSDDPVENLAIYNQKRRGYEGKEKTVLISMMIRQI